MKLTIGSGPHYAKGWVNLDVASLPEWKTPPDVIASVYDMPFENETFSHVYLGHVLEHLMWETLPEALAEVRRVSKPGAQVVAVGPCINYARKTKQPQWLLDAIIAKEGSQGGFEHAWTPTAELTKEAMELGGLREVTLVPVRQIQKPEWPNPSTAAWQCAVRAIV